MNCCWHLGRQASSRRVGAMHMLGGRYCVDATMAYSGYRGEVPAWDLGFERNDDVDLPNAAKLFKGAYGDHVRVHVNAYRASEIFEDDIRENGDQKGRNG